MTLSSRSSLNLALLGVVAILLLITVYEPGITPPAPAARLLPNAPEEVKRLRIERPGQPAVSLERHGQGWAMTQPYALPADATRVASLLKLPQARSESQLAVAGLDLAEFGLAEPKATLYLNDIRVDFGGTEPLNGWRYVRIGDTVHLSVDRFYYLLISNAGSLVDRSLLPAGAQPMTIRLPGTTLRQVNGKWTLDPDDPAVSADAISTLVQAWRSAQAVSVNAVKAAAEGKPVSIELADGRRLHFKVLAGDLGPVFARPEAGVQYELAPGADTPLLNLGAREGPAPGE